MNGKNLLQRLGGLVLAASLLFGVAILSNTTVQAQRGFHGGGGFHGRGFGPRFGFGNPYWYGYGYGYGYPYGYYSQYVFGDSEGADAQGYHDGQKTGSKDAKRGQSNDAQRSHYFKDSGFGNFAGDYRKGFTRGYAAGFRG